MSDLHETLTRAIQGAITSAAAQHREVSELTWCCTLAEVLESELEVARMRQQELECTEE